jgi:hypothetical protein
MVSDQRLYKESLSAAKRLENWKWEFRSCRRIVVGEREPREWGYNGVQRSTTEIRELELEDWVEFGESAVQGD